MDVVTQGAGLVIVIAAALLLFAALVAALLVRRIGRWVGGLAVARQPDSITLRQTAEPDWQDPAALALHAAALTRLGYAAGGVAAIEELEDVLVAGFAHPEARLFAAIVEHPGGALTVDVAAEGQDGSSVTATNAKGAAGIASPPWKTVLRRPGATASELHELALARAPAPRRGGSAAAFARFFEQSWRRDVAWQKVRGGATAAEVDAIARSPG